MSKYNLTDIAEGMGYKEFEDAKEKERLEAHPEKDTIKKIKALMDKEKSMKEDQYDDIVAADDDIPADKKKDAAAAYRKVDKGESFEKATSHIKEANIDREVAERIEGMLSIPMKAKFLSAWEDLFYDLVEEDPFYVDDVIAHLSNEMGRVIDGNQMVGDRLAGIGESSDEYVDEIGEGAMQPGEADLEAGVKGNMDAFSEGYEETKGKALYPILKAGANATGDEVEMYVKSLAKDIELNGKEQYKDFTSDDFVEDFKNYIADKSLQEHFGRFLKDYQ